MADNIASVYAVQYGTNVSLLLQQRGSRFRRAVQTGSYSGKQAEVVTQYGKTEARRVTGRYDQITHVNTPNDRRWVYPSDYDWSDIIGSFDKLRVLSDPMGAYTQNGLNAMGRAMDEVIIEGMLGDNKTGEAGGTTESFDTTNNRVAVNHASSANVGMTVDKLREGRRLLMAAEVDLDMEDPWVGITSQQHDDLLGQIQIVSSDFNGGQRPVLQDGKVQRFLGCNFINSERLLNTTTPYRRCPMWVQSGVHLGIWNDVTSDVSPRKDMSGLPWQIYIMMTLGATRTEQDRVLDILCNEA